MVGRTEEGKCPTSRAGSETINSPREEKESNRSAEVCGLTGLGFVRQLRWVEFGSFNVSGGVQRDGPVCSDRAIVN